MSGIIQEPIDFSPRFTVRVRAVIIATRRRSAFCMIAVLALVDWFWSLQAGLTVTGWWRNATVIALFGLIPLYCGRVRIAPRVAELATYVALWAAFTELGCVLTYFAASTARPLADASFAAADTSMGFDWVAWVAFVRSHPSINVVLSAAYGSLMLQIVGSLILFSLAGITGRNEELLQNAIIALLLTVLVAAMVPALGPWVHFGYGAARQTDTTYVAHVMALRQHVAPPFVLSQMQGIVCFPSYHTVLGILFVYAHRGLRWSFAPIMMLNGLMLFSIPSEGGHYLVDIIAGAVVAVLTIGITRVMIRASYLRPLPLKR